MRFLRPLPGVTRRDKQRNVDVRNRLNQDIVTDEIKKYQQHWLPQVNRMESNCLRNLALQYQLHGKKDIGRRRRRWREQDYRKANELHRTRRTALNLQRLEETINLSQDRLWNEWMDG
jgi:hypothetical protein